MEKLRVRVGKGVLKYCLSGISLPSRGHPPRESQAGHLAPSNVNVWVARQWSNEHEEVFFFLLMSKRKEHPHLFLF